MRYKPKSSQDNTATVTVYGIDFEVKFDYSPAEPMTYWEPGCDEQYDVWEIKPATIQDIICMQVEELTEADLKSDWFGELIEIQLAEQYKEFKRGFRDDYDY